MRGEDIVKYRRAQGILWWGHLNRMGGGGESEENCRMESHRNETQRTFKN
jgi:hypothetical protein